MHTTQFQTEHLNEKRKIKLRTIKNIKNKCIRVL